MASSHQQKLAHALLPLAQLSGAVLRAAGTTTCTARFAEIQRVFQGRSDVSGLLKGVRRSHSTLHTTSLAHGSFPLHVYQHVVPASNVVKNASFHHQHGRERQQVVLHQGWHQPRHFRTHSIALKESKSTAEDCDRIVEEMRYRNIKVPKQLEISWRRRIEGWVVGAWNGGKAVVKFSFSLPGMLYRTITMSPSEWYKFLSGTWATVKHEAEYYWVGFKLFGFELRVATGLVWKRLKGGHLSRRERRQLTRTSADLIRVIPFSLFIIIPFAEALLPLAIRLFPNLLPSTFETPLKREEDLKKLLKLKTELAGFLQQTVGELAKDVKKSSSGEVADEAKALQVFLTDVRDGKSVNNNDIVKFARLFNDELTLDNLDRVHLLTLCQFLSLPTIPSTEAILRTRLQAHLVELRADDIEIKSEGIENLTDDEMRSAARARGMPAPFGRGCTTLLRKQLQDWIDLSLDKNIPSSLLLLSRAFKMTTLAKRAPSAEKSKDSATETVESLKDTFNMLPEEAIEGVEMERFKSSAGLQKRLEYLQREEEEIKEENEEENSKELSDARAALEESHSRLGKVVTTSAQATAKAVVRKAAAEAAQDAISRKQEETGDSAQSQVAYKDAREKEKKMGALISSLVALAHASGVAQERALFMEVASREVESQMVKLGGGSYLEFGGAKKQVSGVRPAEERVDHVTENMQASIQNMLIRIESELDAADSTIGQKLHLLDTDADGIVSKDELLNAMTLLRGNRSEAEVGAVKKLLDGRQTVTLEQLEELGQKLALSKSSKDDPAKGK